MNYRETEDGTLESRCCGNCKSYTYIHFSELEIPGKVSGAWGCCCKKHDTIICYFAGTCDDFERDKCPLCNRVVPEEYWEKHHLIPKSKGGKNTVHVCVSCGDMVHKLIPLNLLKTQYNTVEKLLQNPDVQNWVKWVQKKPNDFRICMQRKKKR